MKQRILSTVLVLCMLLTFLPLATVSATSDIAYPVEGGNIYLEKSTGTIVDCDKSVTSANIPAEIDGVAVTGIGNHAFYGCSSLKSVTIPNSVTAIGVSAFEDCSSMTSVTIPESVMSIGSAAFNCCESLTSITIPEGVTSIGDTAFFGCESLASVTIPDRVTSIGEYAFYYCGSLASITIPSSVTSIGNSAFEECSSLTSVIVGSGVTSIGKSAFAFCGTVSLYFRGKTPTIDLSTDNGSFHGSNVMLYYVMGKSGWTSPTWNDFPTATWDGVNFPHTHSYRDGKCTVCGAVDPTYSALDSADVFKDVGQNDWYKSAVDYAINHKLFNGTSPNTFDPESPMTRAMLVTVLWRSAGELVEGTNTFSDVPNDQYYAQPVAWAAANGIVTGTSPTTFEPDENVTREQLATILYRYTKKLGVDVSASGDLTKFSDHTKANDWALDALKWAVGAGIISGDRQGNTVYLDPQGNATRAQVATIFMRYLENVVK